jgi:hypothetical protein
MWNETSAGEGDSASSCLETKVVFLAPDQQRGAGAVPHMCSWLLSPVSPGKRGTCVAHMRAV